MRETLTKNPQETGALAREFAVSIASSGGKEGARVVALYGDLGSGKTSFAQGVAKALGVGASVISPTFVIERIYILSHKNFDHLVHIDCYRIETAEEMRRLDWDEKIKNPKNLILVEWADKIEEILPKDSVRIYFEHVDENKRKIVIQNC